MVDNSQPAPSKNKKYCVKFNDSWCKKFSFRTPRNVKFLHYVLRVEAISVLHIEERMILIDTRTPHSIKNMRTLLSDKENQPILVQVQRLQTQTKKL